MNEQMETLIAALRACEDSATIFAQILRQQCETLATNLEPEPAPEPSPDLDAIRADAYSRGWGDAVEGMVGNPEWACSYHTWRSPDGFVHKGSWEKVQEDIFAYGARRERERIIGILTSKEKMDAAHVQYTGRGATFLFDRIPEGTPQLIGEGPGTYWRERVVGWVDRDFLTFAVEPPSA